MSIRLYDEALSNKIKSWVKDPNLTILKPDETARLFQMKADQVDDKPISLPFVALSRDKETKITNIQKQSKTFSGFIVQASKQTTMTLNVIPIRIGYQLDIYTRKMEEADEYIRNFIFNFVNYPKLVVNLPYNNANLTHEANVWLDDSIIDNSDIKEHLFADQFYRFSLKLYVDDAYLFSLPVKETPKIESIEFAVEDTDKSIIENTLIYKK